MAGLTSTVLMIRPCSFGYNEQTAATNAMQVRPAGDSTAVQLQAAEEFGDYVNLLRAHGIEVIEVVDTKEPPTPDSIFPNNWFTTHDDNFSIVLYPMQCENRRAERSKNALPMLCQTRTVLQIRNLSLLEKENEFLEGTGSLVLDRVHKIAFAALSPRTTHFALTYWSEELGYKVVDFVATDSKGTPIYHTNVMMTIGDNFAIICTDFIRDKQQLSNVLSTLTRLNKEIIAISEDQVTSFAGNALQLINTADEKVLVMSASGWQKLRPEQQALLTSLHSHIITPHIQTIESIGGGSARCMLAEVFLPARESQVCE